MLHERNTMKLEVTLQAELTESTAPILTAPPAGELVINLSGLMEEYFGIQSVTQPAE